MMNRNLVKSFAFQSWMGMPFFSVLIWLWPSLLLASPVLDSARGLWADDYANNVGINFGQSSNITHNLATGEVEVAASETSGVFESTLIQPPPISSWLQIITQANLGPSSGGFLRLDVLDAAGNPIAGQQGLNAYHPVSLAALSTASFGAIRLRFTLLAADRITHVKLSWVPKSALKVSLSAPVNTQRLIECTIACSVAHTPAADLHCRLEISPPAPAYVGQQTSVGFVSAESGGVFEQLPGNPAAIVWQLGETLPGEPIVLKAQLQLPEDIRHGQVFTLQAKVSESTTLSTSPPVSVTSVVFPNPLLQLAIGENVLATASGDTVIPGPAPEFIVQFSLVESDPALPGKLVQPVVYESLTHWLSVFTPSSETLAISAGGRFEPAYIPPGGGLPRPAVVWDLPPLLPGQTWTGNYRPTLLPAAFSPGSTITREASCYASELGFNPNASRSVRLGSTSIVAGEFAVGDFGVTPEQDGMEQAGMVGFPLSYQFRMTNRNLVELHDIVILAPVPAHSRLLNWRLDTGSIGTLFYSTTTDPAYNASNPPPVDVAEGSSDINPAASSLWLNWTSSPPANLAAVTWVAVHVPELGSVFSTTTLPVDAEAILDVEPLSSAAPICGQSGVLALQGRAVVFRKAPIGGGSTAPADGSGSFVQNNQEFTAIHPSSPRLTLAPITRTLLDYDSATDLVKVRFDGRLNVSALPATDVKVHLSWELGQGSQHSPPLAIADLSPSASAQLDPDETGLMLSLGALSAGQGRDFSLTLQVPLHLAAQNYPPLLVQASAAETACAALLPQSASSPLPGTQQTRFLVSLIHSPPFVSEGFTFTQSVTFANAGTTASVQNLGLIRLSPRTQLVRVDASPDLPLYGVSTGLPPEKDWFELSPSDLSGLLTTPTWVVDAAASHGGYWTLPPSTQWLVILLDHPATGQWLPGQTASLSWTHTHQEPLPLDDPEEFSLIYTEAFLVGGTPADSDQKITARSGSHITQVWQNPDGDSDGLPDGLEDIWFTSLNQDSDGDFDNDGYSNYMEWLLGTAPSLASSSPRIAFDLSDPDWIRYDIPNTADPGLIWQYSHTLAPGSWNNLPMVRWAGHPVQIPRLGISRSFLRIQTP